MFLRKMIRRFLPDKHPSTSWHAYLVIRDLEQELAKREKQVVKVLKDKKTIERKNAELNKQLIRCIRDH